LPSTPAASTPHHILNEGARRLLALGRADLAEALVAQALASNEDNADPTASLPPLATRKATGRARSLTCAARMC
jgi:hypothetical protein